MRKGEHWSEEGKEYLKSIYTPEKKKEMSDTLKEVWKDPVYADKVSKGIKQAYIDDPEKGKKRGKLLKEFYRDNEEALRNLSDRSKKLWQDPEYRKRVCTSLKLAYMEGRKRCNFHTTTQTQEKSWFNRCDVDEKPVRKANNKKEFALCTNEEVLAIYEMSQPFREYLISIDAPKSKIVVEDRLVPEDILTYDQIAEIFNTSRRCVYCYANKLTRKELLRNI